MHRDRPPHRHALADRLAVRDLDEADLRLLRSQIKADIWEAAFWVVAFQGACFLLLAAAISKL